MEVRGYSEPIELYAPLIPEVVSPGEPGHDVADPLASPAGDGLGRPIRAGDGLGKRPASGLGTPCQRRARPQPPAGRLVTRACLMAQPGGTRVGQWMATKERNQASA